MNFREAIIYTEPSLIGGLSSGVHQTESLAKFRGKFLNAEREVEMRIDLELGIKISIRLPFLARTNLFRQ